MNENYLDVTPLDIFENSNLSKIVRHHKIIKRNDYNSKVIKEIKCSSDNRHIEYKYVYNDYLSQDVDNYDNIYLVDFISLYNSYKDLSLMRDCSHNKLVLYGKHFDSLTDLQDTIVNSQVETKRLCINDIEWSEFSEDELNELEVLINKFKNKNITNLYIRMAPSKNMKEELLQRLYKLQEIEIPDTYKEKAIYTDDGIPVYNGHIVYSTKKYEKINELINE